MVWPALLAGLFLGLHSAAAQSSGVLRELYLNIPGVLVSDLTNAAKFPNNPDSEEILTNFFEAPVDTTGDNYGQRLRALLIPPVNGSYVFYISSDDASVLYLSTNENPANKAQIASVATWTGSRIWQETRDNNAAVQISAPQTLTAGTRYYIEALMKEGQGGDNLAVTWQKPGDAAPVNGVTPPIPGANLVPFGLGPPIVTVQPANVSVSEGGSASFSVQLARSLGVAFQWVRNGTNIPGANSSSYSLGPVTLADTASTFYCSVTNSFGGTNSTAATLTVNPDNTKPTLVSVVNLGDNQIVTVAFSEPVEPASASLASNYTLNNSATIQNASLGDDGASVTLTTTPLAFNLTYTLTVNNVRDRAQTPNTILANSQKTFTLTYAPLDVSYIKGAPEPIGPSSRRTGLVISEIMYHPPDRTDGRNLEFIEIYNSNPWPEDIGNHRVSGAADFKFAPGTAIGALSYLVVAPKPADIQAVYGISGVFGPLTNSAQPGNLTNVIDNGGGTIRLRDELDSVLLEAVYDDEPPYPAAADGTGHSLVLARPTWGEGNAKAWAASDRVGGTPGTNEVVAVDPFRTVVINEFLAHTDPPLFDFIELFNYSASAVNLSGCILTDDPVTNKFVIPPGTIIGPRGFVSYDQNQLGFALAADGETIFFKNTNATKVLDAVRFDSQENGVSMGRYPDGAPGFHRLAAPTPGTNNTRLLISDIVINEIMYDPVSGENDDQFVELYNHGTNTVDLSKWRLRGGISFTLPSPTVLASNSYLVIAANLTNLIATHSGLTLANTRGNFSGKLGHGGDTVKLEKPDDLATTNLLGQLVTNKIHIAVDEVTYATGGRWGQWSHGDGSSLELIDAHSDDRLAPNWADSDETTKSAWVTVEFTGLLDNGAMANADQLHIFLLGAGECLVDNVEVIPQGGATVLPNGTFDSGASGWVFQGTHDHSYWQASGGFSGGCLHVVASNRGDTGANRIRAPLITTLGSGTTATLRAKVKWLKGHPEILLRLHGNYLEAPGYFLNTRNLGTPGAPNSQARANAGPAITDVSHTPILPAAAQAVTVVARVSDPDSLSSLFLKYRVDPATNYTSVAMIYNGAGFYSASIPGQSAGVRAAFYLEAKDNFVPRATTAFPNDAPARECLVGFGESAPSGPFGAYRLWCSQANVNRWAAREKNSNEPLDVTFVYGNFRAAYNASSLYSGSPWHTPGYDSPVGAGCDYVVHCETDDVVLGAQDFVLATVGNLGSDPSFQAEQTAFWIGRKIGAPYMHRRHIFMFFNALQRQAVYEDSQQPSSDVVKQFFPDDNNGNLHKIEDWFEFDDSGDGKLGNVDATMQLFTTAGGVKKTARYRWNFRPRAVTESANDFTNFFGLVDAVNATQPEPYRSLVEERMDVDEYMRVLAMERIAGNWDSFGYSRGKNMYCYKPENGPWRLLPWDIDFVLGSGSNGSSDPLFGSNEPTLDTLRNFPAFQRAYWRAFEDAVNGPLDPANLNPLLDGKYNALSAAGTGAGSPQFIKDYVAQRRSFIQGQLAGVGAVFRVDGPASFSTNRNLLVLTGTAPIKVETLTINGVVFRPTWGSVSNWSVRVALNGGANSLSFAGYDNQGRLIPSVSATLNITYTGVTELPQDDLVINEIMYNPAVPDAEFLELYNVSANNAFDLSRWRIDAIGLDIPDGTIIEPGQFLVFVKDRDVFTATYGSSVPVAGVYDGSLDNGGETLQLVKPGATPAQNQLIDRVTYDDASPWPAAADGGGASLQLIDAAQDNNRVANWAVGTTNAPPPPLQWVYVAASGTASSSTLYIYLGSAGDVYIDDLQLVAGSVPGAGPNVLPNGDFESALSGPWVVSPNLAGSALSTSVKHSGNASLHVVASSGGTTRASAIYQDIAPALVTNAPYSLSYWYLQSSNGGPLTIRLSGSGIVTTINPAPPGGATNSARYTPGAPNSVRATLPAFPKLWLNELQPTNSSGPTDHLGHRHPWVELYNSGTNAISLAGFYLANNYSNLTQWAFPSFSIGATQFLVVWLDGNPGESTATEFHTSFTIPPAIGSLALTKTNAGTTNLTIVDYLNFNVPSAARTYGDYPDGNVSGRQLFSIITPGATNDPTGASVQVFINEWMADNAGTVADPADTQFEDWIELYNASTDPADLSGYFLANSTTNFTQWQIPSGTIIPGRGYLLVWADGETGQNLPGFEPHANFKLSKLTGETIALFAPGGVLIDSVSFGAQFTDISQGRFPDGGASIYFMTNATPRAANVIPQQGNHPPTLAAIGNKTVSEGALLTFTASVTDPDLPAQTLTCSLDPGAPPGAGITTNGVFSWIPTEAQGPGNYSITVRVTDSGSPPMGDTKTFSVQVNEVNNPPKLANICDRTINETVTLTITNSATDPDSPAQTLTFTLDSGFPRGMAITPNGILTFTPDESQGPGSYPVTVRVTDNGEPPLSDTKPFTVIVSEVNNTPFLSPIANYTNHAGNLITFTASASDTDLPANLLTFSLPSGAPTNAAIGASSGVFSWTPTPQQSPSTNPITVRVTDNGLPNLSASRTFSVFVYPPLAITNLTKSASVVTMTWPSAPGRSYQVQSKTNLQDAIWLPQGGSITATGLTTSATNNIGTAKQRFYRLLLGP